MTPHRRAALVFALRAVTGGFITTPPALARIEPRSVTVAMKEYEFIPSHLTFKRGISCRLHFVNQSMELHEFTALKFFQSVFTKKPPILANGHGEIVLQPHETKDFYFVPKKTGHFALTSAGHDWVGRVGDISVE